MTPLYKVVHRLNGSCIVNLCHILLPLSGMPLVCWSLIDDFLLPWFLNMLTHLARKKSWIEKQTNGDILSFVPWIKNKTFFLSVFSTVSSANHIPFWSTVQTHWFTQVFFLAQNKTQKTFFSFKNGICFSMTNYTGLANIRDVHSVRFYKNVNH